jgi:cell division protein FtsB
MIEGATPDPAEPLPARPAARRRLTAQESRDRRRRLVTWCLSITLGVLVINALIGDSGYLAHLQIRREAAALTADVARLRLENRALQQAGRRLQSDPAAIEDAARRDLGFVRPGETLVIIRDAQPATSPSVER